MRTLITLLLTIYCYSLFGQQLILDSIDLNSGDYKFYFVEKRRGIEEVVEPIKPVNDIISEPPFKLQIDSTYSFLIDNQQQLQRLKSNWEGTSTDEMLLCWYDYFVYIVKNNDVKHELRVNLDCGQVVTNFGIFNFKGNPFEQLEERIPIWVVTSKHASLESGREFIKSLNETIVLPKKDYWFQFDGHFSVDQNYNDASTDEFEQLINETYDKTRYKLKLSGVGPSSFTFRVYSDSTFYADFKFGKKGKWYREKPNWITYFSENRELLIELIK
jgi:hypothetical protein